MKSTWVTRRVPLDLAFRWIPAERPRIGDLLLCELIAPSLHGRVETRTGSRAKLYPGDLLVCTPGNRYATALLEGTADILGEEADLLSASGVCGRVLQQGGKKAPPTTLRIVGHAFGSDGPINLSQFAMPGPRALGRVADIVLVVGSAMDSGKTTACTSVIRSLTNAGRRVGAVKLTGTASARDVGSYVDAGADPVFDFLDCGWPSTAGCSEAELARIADELLGHQVAAGVQAIVIEIADGLLQSETNALLRLLLERNDDIRVVFTARESMAGVAGVERLRRMGYEVTAVSGLVTNSPLARREVELATGLPCIPTSWLGQTIARLDRPFRRERRARDLDTVA